MTFEEFKLKIQYTLGVLDKATLRALADKTEESKKILVTLSNNKSWRKDRQ